MGEEERRAAASFFSGWQKKEWGERIPSSKVRFSSRPEQGGGGGKKKDRKESGTFSALDPSSFFSSPCFVTRKRHGLRKGRESQSSPLREVMPPLLDPPNRVDQPKPTTSFFLLPASTVGLRTQSARPPPLAAPPCLLACCVFPRDEKKGSEKDFKNKISPIKVEMSFKKRTIFSLIGQSWK